MAFLVIYTILIGGAHMLKQALFVLIVILFFLVPVHAQTKPADSMIKAAVIDLDKYEKQAEGLTPSRKANIVRIQRMLPGIESRLNRSKNKSDPSWIEASDRLKALEQRLTDLKAGKTPTATATKTPASGSGTADMTDKQIADTYKKDYGTLANELKGTDISKFADDSVVSGFRAKFASLKTLVDSFQNPKYKQSFSANYQSLEAHFNKKVDHAQGQAASQAKKATAQDDQAKQHQQKKTEQPAPQQQAVKPSAELDFQNKRALGFFKKDYDRYLPEFNNITSANAQKLSGYIDRLENRLSKLTAKGHPDVVDAEQKVAALKSKLAAAQQGQPSQASTQSDQNAHKEFQRLYQRNRVALDSLDPAELSKPAEAKHWKKVLKQFDDIVVKFQNKGNPDVKKDMHMYEQIKTKVETGLTASTKLDIKNYPDYDKDMDFLKALYDKYSVDKVFSKGNEAVAKKLMTDYDNDKGAYDKLDKKYAAFIEGNKAAYAPGYKQAGVTKRNLRNAGQWLDKFSKAKAEFIAEAGPRIEGLMAKAQEMVDKAVREKRPEWFTGGGIQNTMAQAAGQLDSLAAIKGKDDPQVKELRGKYSRLSDQVKKAEDSLKESILAATKMPSNAYSGGDKQQIISLAVKEWNNKHPDKALLAKGVSMPNWERRTEWRYKSGGGARYKVDRSYLQVWVITKTNDTIATQYFIELSKNHMQGDEITLNAPTNLQGDVFKTQMLLKNVK